MTNHKALAKRVSRLARARRDTGLPPEHICIRRLNDPEGRPLDPGPCPTCEEYQAAGREDRITLLLLEYIDNPLGAE